MKLLYLQSKKINLTDKKNFDRIYCGVLGGISRGKTVGFIVDLQEQNAKK
ncbi:hypothetical protein ACFFWB_26710 [Flavobacterium procerum]